MYIQLIEKQEKKIYILCVCDINTKVWAKHFISEKIANALINTGIKLKNN